MAAAECSNDMVMRLCRAEGYAQTNIFVLVYDMTSVGGLENIGVLWADELDDSGVDDAYKVLAATQCKLMLL